MNKKISSLELGILSTYLLKSFILINGINILIKKVGTDSIISILIGFVIGFIYLYFLNKLNSNIFNMTHISKLIFIPLKIILSVFTILFSSYLLYSISMFIKATILNNMDLLPISILFEIIILYTSSKGILTICRSSFICFFIFFILEVITFLFTIPNIDSLNVLPLITNDVSDILKSSLLYSILSSTPLFLLTCVDKDKIYKISKNIKFTRLFYIITNIYIIFNFILVLSVINYKFASEINYPEVFVLSKISLLNFFDRMEGILSFKLILDVFFTLSLALYYITKAIKSITKNNTIIKITNFLIPIIILLISNYINFSINFITIVLGLFTIINIVIILMIAYSNNQKHKKKL